MVTFIFNTFVCCLYTLDQLTDHLSNFIFNLFNNCVPKFKIKRTHHILKCPAKKRKLNSGDGAINRYRLLPNNHKCQCGHWSLLKGRRKRFT